ncbi:MAG: Laccase domain protein YfiH [Chlamydiae bacterium]|nr:Laccase domain protein YfiH [Chlamydiota bacterium]
MIRYKKENIEWLEFELLQSFPEIIHGVVLRCLDFDEKESYQKVGSFFGIGRIVSSHQMHQDRIVCVPQEMVGKCDGLMTKETDCGLVIQHADCQAAIFFDPTRKVIANIHCGWRGSVQNIYDKTVERMKGMGCLAKDLIVCISPSLGPKKAEFVNHAVELPKTFLPFQVRSNYFDFWEISKMQLKEAGVLEKNIEIAGMCTYSEEKHFFSYRRDKKRQRHGTLVALKD